MGGELDQPQFPHFLPEWGGDETWFDLLPPGEPEPPSITRSELLAILEAGGVDVSERTLRYWERSELDRLAILPRGRRGRYGGATQSLYPEWTPAIIARFRYFQQQGRSLQEARERLRNWLEALFNQPPERRGLTRSTNWSTPDWLRLDTEAYERLMRALGAMAMLVEIPRGARIRKVHVVFEDEHGYGALEPVSFGITHPSLEDMSD